MERGKGKQQARLKPWKELDEGGRISSGNSHNFDQNLERGGVANSFALHALCSREQYEDDYQSGSLDI
ncbi:MAG: hypothetical protein COX14_04110 [Chloroflexi bacterium CG23_combo_of_CG06-09_8_20_14_all_45_10]|nr:MAG: hypothetical protein COX14_04110 [Chloroflexi bacterium CG23_combo_of_CG06-09_8_20_14_all_45_10]